MASNNFWVDDLFPPRFKLTSSFDCSEKSKTSYPSRTRDVQQIYEDVYLSTTFSEKWDELNGESKTLKEVMMESAAKEVTQPSLKVNPDSSPDENKTKRNVTERKCMWSTDELKVLRNSLKRSRLNNIRLCVLTRSLQKDCEHLKNICQERAREILEWNKKYNEVRKQNKRMKVTCRAFKQDAKRCNAELEECKEFLNVALTDKERLELELVQTKKELETKQKQCATLSLDLENQKRLQDKLMVNQQIALGLKEERKINELTTKLKEIQLALEKEKNYHEINRNALEHLRLHFTSGRR